MSVPIPTRWPVTCSEYVVQQRDSQPASGTQPAAATASNGDGANEMVSLAHLVHSADRLGGMVVRSAQVRKVLKSVSQLSPYKATVLISGESGTGKELVARALHTLGPVPNGPFVTLNCSNLVEALAESQLFGHIRGAFTDAREESQGYFRSANGGTLFLDEIGELPLKLQPKLLRSVETHEVQPVGSSQCYKVNLRLVAATNRDLRAMVRAGNFRDDLFYRMSASSIFIPPLRERREAIPAFIGFFIEQYNRLFGKDGLGNLASRHRNPLRISVAGKCPRTFQRDRKRRDAERDQQHRRFRSPRANSGRNRRRVVVSARGIGRQRPPSPADCTPLARVGSRRRAAGLSAR